MMLFADIPIVSDEMSSLDAVNSESSPDIALPSDIYSGTLDSVLIKHTGASAGMTQIGSARTDVNPNPSSEVYLPVGASSNMYSGECSNGGYLRVGAGGSADFGSPAGTISFWGKWDSNAPHGRFWGQDGNFETRWSSDRIMLDWGSDITLQGTKDDWEIDHWYFITITWDEVANSLAIYWGDETDEPTLDASTAWSYSVVGLHTENNLMSSRGLAGAEVDGKIDDFRYYSIQRNLTDITEDYLFSSTITDPNLSAHYRFENDLSDSVGDLDLHIVGTFQFSHDVSRTSHGWYGDQIKVTAGDVRKLYARNGTFETGYPGTNEDWSGDGIYFADGWFAQCESSSILGKQRASYVEDIDDYVLVENEGYNYYLGNAYRHYNDTQIYWYQTIDNSEQNELFMFNLDYNYMRGPIGNHFAGIFQLRFEILDGSTLLWNWSIDLTNVTQRQNWFSTGQIPVNITGAPSSFTTRVMLLVETVSAYVSIDETDSDLDGDSTNGQFVTVYLDNLELKGLSISCKNVDLVASTAKSGSVNFSEFGVALLNYTYWSNYKVPINFLANSSITFDFSAEFSKMHRYYNSSYISNLENLGSSYSVNLGTEVNITFYTYIQSSPEAKDLGFIIYSPSDWVNATVEDPFGSMVVTSQNDFIEVAPGLVDSVGWWKIRLKAPNYAQIIQTQTQDEFETGWGDAQVFYNGDKIRCYSMIGTSVNTVISITNLEIIWYLPSHLVWHSDLLNNASGSIVTSSELVLDSTNTTPGEWLVTVMWVNGTEVAFGFHNFEIHHQLHMIAQTPYIYTQLDEMFTVAVYLYDQDTGTPLLSDAAVVGNWSSTEVSFNQNLAKGWWEADFNSSVVGTGGFSILVNATIPYYSIANYTITVEITTVTLMTVLGTQYIEIDPNDSCNVSVRYMFLNGDGIEGANVSLLSFSGPPTGLDYEEAYPIIGEPGNYTLEFTASLSGTYFITLTAVKEHHNLAAASFYIIVGAVPSVIEVHQSEFPDVLYFNQTYTTSLYYHTEDLSGIEDAIVNITYNPVSFIEWTELDNGFYNISIRIPEVGSYAVYLRFSKLGFEYADISFSFEVIEIPTSIAFYGMQSDYYQGHTYDFAIYYDSFLTDGIKGANLIPSVAIRNFYEFSKSGDGWYNFSLSPIVGSWNVTFWVTKEGFEEQVYNFVLTTVLIPIELSQSHPLNATYTKFVNDIFSITLIPISGDTGIPILGADISYTLIDTESNFILAHGFLNESSGLYTFNITVPDVGLYLLRIIIARENHVSFTHDIILNSIANPASLYTTYLQAGLIGALILFCCIVSIMIGRRFYISANTKRNIKLADLKGRLDDAKNLIGLLIIQRKNGLPLYSKILKGGFQESLLSSFISAISNFREELSMDAGKWIAIPITEVITAVQTEELICTIITVESASVRQKIQLETFSREIGGLYDHDDKFVSPVFRSLSSDALEPFNQSFDSYFDGGMFLRYVGVKKTLPKHLSSVSSVFKTMSIDHGVTVEAIIKALVLQGLNEGRAFNMVMESIDKEYLIASEMKLPSPVHSEFEDEI